MGHRSTAGGGLVLRAAVRLPGDRGLEECERELLERGVPLPATQRLAWSSVEPGTATWFVAVVDGESTCRYGMGVRVARSRALPGHLLMRVERLDPAVDLGACEAAVQALATLARRRWPRVLRVSVELFSLDAVARARLATRLTHLGFRPVERPRMYRFTAIVDLSGDEAAIFARLHRSARRNVRTTEKSGLVVRTIDDPALAPRLDTLAREAFARTAGRYRQESWGAIIELSRRQPELSRLVGLFRQTVDEPDSLLAFEWGCMHGDHAQSIAAGSTRPSGTRTPLAHALVWDLISWAKQQGARYFDLGGITHGALGSADPLGGISDFKRSFGATVVEVGAEWSLEPHPLATRVAGALSRLAAALRPAGRG